MPETNHRDILIVEDDAKIADMLANYLQSHAYTTRIIGDGLAALRDIQRSPPALLLLDLMLPGMEGVALCREVRRFSGIPIIMLTARVDEIDRLVGLEVGADDYICKPFSPREVVARVKALLRRAQGHLVHTASSHGFRVDDGALRIGWRQHWLALTPVEFRLFKLLLSRPEHVFSRARLLEAVHEDFRDTTDRAIDSHIKNLRRKIDAVRPQGSGIVSVYGVGYRFDPEPAEA
jgi:two-component system response regulator BaeR